MSGHTWTTRSDDENNRITVTEAPSEGCFYVEIEDGWWPAARLSPDAAQSLAEWLHERLADRRDLGRITNERLSVPFGKETEQ